MRILRCILLLLLAIILPSNAAMAGFVQQKDAQGHALPVPERISIHEHYSVFGAPEQHTHKASEELKLDGCKPCSFAKDAQSSQYRSHPIVLTSSVWTGSDEQFPSDHAPAPPEHPPKTRA